MIRTHGRWGDEEALNDAAHREADELGGHHEEPLITKGPVLAIKLSLYGNNVGLRTICQRGGTTGAVGRPHERQRRTA